MAIKIKKYANIKDQFAKKYQTIKRNCFLIKRNIFRIKPFDIYIKGWQIWQKYLIFLKNVDKLLVDIVCNEINILIQMLYCIFWIANKEINAKLSTLFIGKNKTKQYCAAYCIVNIECTIFDYWTPWLIIIKYWLC